MSKESLKILHETHKLKERSYARDTCHFSTRIHLDRSQYCNTKGRHAGISAGARYNARSLVSGTLIEQHAPRDRAPLPRYFAMDKSKSLREAIRQNETGARVICWDDDEHGDIPKNDDAIVSTFGESTQRIDGGEASYYGDNCGGADRIAYNSLLVNEAAPRSDFSKEQCGRSFESVDDGGSEDDSLNELKRDKQWMDEKICLEHKIKCLIHEMYLKDQLISQLEHEKTIAVAAAEQDKKMAVAAAEQEAATARADLRRIEKRLRERESRAVNAFVQDKNKKLEHYMYLLVKDPSLRRYDPVLKLPYIPAASSNLFDCRARPQKVMLRFETVRVQARNAKKRLKQLQGEGCEIVKKQKVPDPVNGLNLLEREPSSTVSGACATDLDGSRPLDAFSVLMNAGAPTRMLKNGTSVDFRDAVYYDKEYVLRQADVAQMFTGGTNEHEAVE